MTSGQDRTLSKYTLGHSHSIRDVTVTAIVDTVAVIFALGDL